MMQAERRTAESAMARSKLRTVGFSVGFGADGGRNVMAMQDFVYRDSVMSRFESVTVTVAANVYFDGRVSSRTVEFPDGTTKTLGLMLPGEYSFNTAKPELMEVTAGQAAYCLAGESEWHSVGAGDSFNVPGNSSFQIRVAETLDYICSFLDD